MRAIRDYEIAVKFLQEEREKYKTMLYAEYGKLSNVLQEGIKKFNARLSDFLLTKIKVQSATDQEKLRIHRVRLKNHKRMALQKQENKKL